MEGGYYERYWGRLFDENNLFARPPEHNVRERDRIISILKPYVSGRVLDAGCGDGFITNAISKLPSVTEVRGVDISKKAILVAKSKYPHIIFEAGQATDLPFESNYFDIITAIELIEHVYDTELMFKEFSRVLKKGGHLIITTTDFNLLKKVVIALFFWDRYFHPTNPHIRFYTKKSLEKMLVRFGFERVAYRWNGNYFGVMPKGQIMVARK